MSFVHRFEPGARDGLTLLLLHGTGGNEDELLPLGRAIAPGAALLSPRGKVSENGMPRFFRRVAEGVFDQADLRFRSGELAGFVRAASGEYRFDLGSLVMAGYSNGANIAAAMMLLETLIPARAVLFRPMVPLVPEVPPRLEKTRVFVSAGRFDPIVAREQPQRLAGLLRDAGAEVTLNWEDGAHSLTEHEVLEAAEWLPRMLS